MDQAFDNTIAADRELSRLTFDVNAVAAKVGNDPVKLFEWVRENTFFVPYRGVLRGPSGVLMDRVGNSLDRSLLLADLLRVSGQEVRLAHARLSSAQATSHAALRALVTPAGRGPRSPPPGMASGSLF
jgi:transglutaminase-like putative cysteine protease